MKRTLLTLAATTLFCLWAAADTLDVRTFRCIEPVRLMDPFRLDSLDNHGRKFDAAALLSTAASASSLEASLKAARSVCALPAAEERSVGAFGFKLDNTAFTKADLDINGIGAHKVYVDGALLEGNCVKLEPGTHRFTVVYLTEGSDSLKVSLAYEGKDRLALREDDGRLFSLDLNTQGINGSGVSVSAGGKFVAVGSVMVDNEGKSTYSWDVVRLSDRKIVSRRDSRISWMPSGDTFYFTRETLHGRELVEEDPESGTRTVLCQGLPKGDFTISPEGKYLVFDVVGQGPKEGAVHQILTPDDRQSGWRDRNSLARFDPGTGILTPLTFGFHNATLLDISADGSRILFSTSRERLTKRPTTLFSIYSLDVNTLEAKCIVCDDGFIDPGSASFSPDGGRILVQGSPDAFGGVGRDLPDSRIASMYDEQLFTVDVVTGKVRPLTRKVDQAIGKAVWSKVDGKIYARAEDKDCNRICRIDPDRGRFEIIADNEDNIKAFSLSEDALTLAWYGESLENTTRVYAMDVRRKAPELLRDFNAERLGGVCMGKGGAYEFKSSRSDMINCFYVLPPDFDPSGSYPMIVHYYGGCNPSARYCVGSYSPQLYAGQGYVYLVVNPSGATGFGQEFSSRHVNTAGEGVAEDIIEAVQNFCKDHPFVNKEKIGCFSASYGGFMTQLLLCKTDMFATGISHAGISDHTSYWGEGYWGYSYSEVCMAESYPWTRKDLYVDRSPLYMADRIHTPLLFLHGSADTNVPIGESIQMFTALKLLGQDTAFVVVDGENHGIREYGKRRDWLRTISAWFARYLKDDSSWWDELYPEKTL